MKNNSRLKLLVLSFVISLCACTSTQNEVSIPADTSNIPVRISTHILRVETSTRVMDNAFEAGDSIGLYMLKEPESITGNRYAENILFTHQSGEFAPEHDLFYPYGDDACTFICYYPYQSLAFIPMSDGMDVRTLSNQKGKWSYNHSDFMLSQVTGIHASWERVTLPHAHKFSQFTFVIQLTGDDDINRVKEMTDLTIENFKTKAVFHLTGSNFSDLSETTSISPNGEWTVDAEKKQLSGKKAIVIPQDLKNTYISLKFGNRNFTVAMPEDMQLQSNTSYKLLLKFDSKIGINSIEPTIDSWVEGESHELSLSDTSIGDCINISQLNYKQSRVFHIFNKAGKYLGNVCREYLANSEINSEAIVFYPAGNKLNGQVLKLLNGMGNKNGGTIKWDEEHNTFLYEAGNLAPITMIYFDKDGQMSLTKPADNQIVLSQPYLLNDVRGSECISYPVVKIGCQYWMADNLRSIFYNDGTPLTDNSSTIENRAGYYLNNTNYFYHAKAVETNKMAPKGWSVPTNSDCEKLKTYLNNKAHLLKSGSWMTDDGIDTPTNMTGFNAEAIGAFIVKDNDDKTGSVLSMTGEGKSFSFWIISNAGEETTVNDAVCLTCKLSEIDIHPFIRSFGYRLSIRCIKQ